MALAAVTTLILALAFLLHGHTRAVQAPATSEAAVISAANPEPAVRMPAVPAARPEVQPSAEEKRLAVSEKMEQLQAWAQTDDALGLANIMSELATNSESKVRLAAITLAKQSGSREIIPALKDAAERAEDLKEKKALLDAVEFLAQPTVSEQEANLQPMVAAAR